MRIHKKFLTYKKNRTEKFMAVIKAEVPTGFKDKVNEARKNEGISESELIRKAVKSYLDTKEKPLSPLQRAGWR
jgi:metal-responsive CopG/Arc/MetJ family transcriptional regulator